LLILSGTLIPSSYPSGSSTVNAVLISASNGSIIKEVEAKTILPELRER
jgi:hypothetical protein